MEPIARLFGSAARLKLLRLFLFNDDRAFTAADAAFRTRVLPSSARKEINVLVATGVVRKRAGKGPLQYGANRKFAHYEALQEFLRHTTGLRDGAMVDTLRRAGTLRLVALSGLFTGAIETKVDLLIVGDKLDERALATAVHALEAELGRELRYASFTSEDYKYRVGVYDRLVRDVFDYPHRTLLDKTHS